MAEEPTVEVPVEPVADKEEWSQEKIDSFVTQLETANVRTPQELEGKLRASKEAGNMANMLGEARQTIDGLNEELGRLKSTPFTPQDNFADEFTQPQPVDIERSVEAAVNKVLTKRDQAMFDAQARSTAKFNAIVTDPNYPHVRDVWEGKFKDLNFAHQINSGALDPEREYNNTVVDFFKGMSIKSAELIKTLQGKPPGQIPPPNMETHQVRTGPETKTSENEGTIKNFQEGVNKGKLLTEDDELAALDAILGTKDPII